MYRRMVATHPKQVSAACWPRPAAELPGEATDAEICYRPVSLGTAERLLPGYLKEEITFRESQVLHALQ